MFLFKCTVKIFGLMQLSVTNPFLGFCLIHTFLRFWSIWLFTIPNKYYLRAGFDMLIPTFMPIYWSQLLSFHAKIWVPCSIMPMLLNNYQWYSTKTRRGKIPEKIWLNIKFVSFSTGQSLFGILLWYNSHQTLVTVPPSFMICWLYTVTFLDRH